VERYRDTHCLVICIRSVNTRHLRGPGGRVQVGSVDASR
jgi:hypothetical protein